MSRRPVGSTFAEVFSAGTRGLKLAPWLDRKVVGENVVPEGWHILRGVHADAEPFKDHWLTYEGDQEASRLPFPIRARFVGIAALSGVEMDKLHRANSGARDGLAVRLGNAIVVGALAEGEAFYRDDSDTAFVGGRILRGALTMLPGIVIGDPSILHGGGVEFQPAVSAVKIGREPVGSVPPEITIP